MPTSTQQTANSIFMVRPASFGFNPQTAMSNTFQIRAFSKNANKQAQDEFDHMVQTLKGEGVDVHVFSDTASPKKPDAIFPNNWVSLHHDGTVVLYPMLAENRRQERRLNMLSELQSTYKINRVVDLTDAELNGEFLEGTGSIVFDHASKMSFACRSERTYENLLNELCAELGYHPICFDAIDKNEKPIYHTNVMMAIGTNWAICCLDAIPKEQQKAVAASLGKKELVTISHQQMGAFAGNVLAIQNAKGEELIVLSKTAHEALMTTQKSILMKHGKLLPIDIPTIEKIGGGSVRCMIAEIFLPKQEK